MLSFALNSTLPFLSAKKIWRDNFGVDWLFCLTSWLFISNVPFLSDGESLSVDWTKKENIEVDINKEERKRKWIGEVEHIDLIPTSVSEELLFKLSFCLIHKKENKKINSTFFLTSYKESKKLWHLHWKSGNCKECFGFTDNNLWNILQICGQSWTCKLIVMFAERNNLQT